LGMTLSPWGRVGYTSERNTRWPEWGCRTATDARPGNRSVVEEEAKGEGEACGWPGVHPQHAATPRPDGRWWRRKRLRGRRTSYLLVNHMITRLAMGNRGRGAHRRLPVMRHAALQAGCARPGRFAVR